MKFITVQTTAGRPQFVSVDDDEVENIASDFATEPVLDLTDAKDGSRTLVNNGQVAYVLIADHRDDLEARA